LVLKTPNNIFEEWMKKLGLESYGKIVTKIAKNEIPFYLINSDVYVCTSDYETFGIAPREAMMCGLPIISTSNGGVEDSITTETGLVVPVRDALALASAIISVNEKYIYFNQKTIQSLGIQKNGKALFLRNMYAFYDL
jgi:glycosyltransferase involved in cell wall biosynthesis